MSGFPIAKDIKDCPPEAHHNRVYKKGMSYAYGPHVQGIPETNPWVYYEGDRRVFTEAPVAQQKIAPTPAWVIADLMLSKHRGQPLTEYEEALISQPFESPGLVWLKACLEGFKEQADV